MAGLTIVLTPEHPDEKGNVKGSCPFPGPLLPLVVEDVGRIDPRSGSGRLATCCFPLSRKAQPIVEKGLGPDVSMGWLSLTPTRSSHHLSLSGPIVSMNVSRSPTSVLDIWPHDLVR